jgi:hypothetical protein
MVSKCGIHCSDVGQKEARIVAVSSDQETFKIVDDTRQPQVRFQHGQVDVAHWKQVQRGLVEKYLLSCLSFFNFQGSRAVWH